MTKSTLDDADGIDSSKMPTGERGWGRLVDWAVSRGDSVESTWLELKSDVDPSTKTGAAKVAKFILAAANRDPENAARHLGGHAALILGVSRGGRRGLPPVESLRISRLVDPFLGSAGPRWDVVRVAGEDNREVIIIVVDPPRQGDPVFIARKNGDDIRDGQIYVRVNGASEPNTSDQFDQLAARASAYAKTDQFDVTIIGEVRSYICDAQVVNDRISAIETAMIQMLPSEKEKEAQKSQTSFNALGVSASASRVAAFAGLSAYSAAMSTPEKRTEDEYRSQVSDYVAECREVVPELVDFVIASVGQPTTFRIKNRNQRFLKSVEFVAHIAGDVEAVLSVADSRVIRPRMFPARPRVWGPTATTFDTPLLARQFMSHRPEHPTHPANPSSWSELENGGSIDAKVGFKLIRPLAPVEEDTGYVFVVRDPELRSLRVEWSATANDVDEVFRGEFHIEVLPPIDINIQLAEALDRILPIN